MNIETRKAKSGKDVFVVVHDEAFEAAIRDGTQGVCLACGAEADGVEPDARKYNCETCDEPRVYGLEELLIMGRAVQPCSK